MKTQLTLNIRTPQSMVPFGVLVLFLISGTFAHAEILYDFGGGDSGYNFTTSNTYESIDYGYDGGDHGYNYTSSNTYEPVEYLYDGGDYGQYESYDNQPYTYTNDYDYDYAPYTTYSLNDYVYPPYTYSNSSYTPYTYGGTNYTYTPYTYGGTNYTHTSYTYPRTDYTYTTTNYERDRVECDAFTISDTRVKDGDYVTLKWRTTDADRVSINQGIGNVNDDGEKRVRVTDDTTYTLTARNGNDSDTCRVNVEVDEKDDTDKTIPRCVLHISDTRIRAGEKVTLSWENSRTDRLILKDSHGKEIADSRDDRGIDEDKDSIVVRPTKSTDYKLTVYKGNIKRTCSVGVDIEKQQVSVTSVRTQGSIPLVSTPYTGFEAGPTLTAIFYIILGLWGVAVGYALVLKKSAVVVASHAVGAAIMTPKVTTSPFVETHTLVMSDFPTNLPTDDSVSHDDMSTEIVSDETATRTLETHAHEQYALFSSDALHYIENQSTTLEGQIETLDRVIGLAKARFPKEGDWIVINKERAMSVLL